MRFTNIWFILTIFWLTGCMTMPADVKTYESKTDNTKHIQMEPGWLSGSMTTRLGLHRTSVMPPDDVIIVVAVKEAAAATKDGLTINVDGEKSTYSAIDDLSDIDEHGFFHKRFPVKLDLVKKMVAGKAVWVKIWHVGQTYSEGEFSKDDSMSAKRGFIKFLAAMEGIK